MADTIGYQFQPGSDQDYRKRLNGIQLGPMANEALKILSLRLPAVLSGRPISPDDLLRPNVGGVAPQSAVLDSLRRTSGMAGMGSNVSESNGLASLIANALGTGSSLGSSPEPGITPGGGGQPVQHPLPVTGAGPGDGRTPTGTPPTMPQMPFPQMPRRPSFGPSFGQDYQQY